MNNRIIVFSIALATAAPLSAFGGEPAWPEGFDAGQDFWRPELSAVVRTDVFGFAPAQIYDSNGDNVVSGEQIRAAGAEVRANVRLYTRYLHLDLQPYTRIPDGVVMVTMAGLEAWLMAPVTDWLRLGLYHHSSHNFSVADYGHGIDLNAVVVDLSPLAGGFTWIGSPGRYRLRLLGHGFLKGNGSPYELTKSTNVRRADIGDSSWRGAVLFDVAHHLGRAECGVTMNAAAVAPASMQAGCAALFRLGDRFLGQLGEHLLAGPFLNYRVNFSRREDFGADAYSAGLMFELHFTDDPLAGRKSP